MVCSRAKVRKITNDFIKRLRRNGLPIDKAYLFGSYAWGRPSSVSDIDMAIISPKFKRWNDIKRIKVLSDIARYVYPNLEVEIDAIGFTHEELENASYFDLAGEIRQKGQIIYNKAA